MLTCVLGAMPSLDCSSNPYGSFDCCYSCNSRVTMMQFTWASAPQDFEAWSQLKPSLELAELLERLPQEPIRLRRQQRVGEAAVRAKLGYPLDVGETFGTPQEAAHFLRDIVKKAAAATAAWSVPAMHSQRFPLPGAKRALPSNPVRPVAQQARYLPAHFVPASRQAVVILPFRVASPKLPLAAPCQYVYAVASPKLPLAAPCQYVYAVASPMLAPCQCVYAVAPRYAAPCWQRPRCL